MVSRETLCRYRTDPDGRLVFVDDGWCVFARENDAADYAVPEALYGRDLLSFISEPTTRHVYAVLMQRVTNHHQLIVLPFRCDSPATRRWLELQMRPLDGGVEFRTREIRIEARRVPFPFAGFPPGSDVMLRMCSWCKQVELDTGRWGQVEEAVTRFQLFGEREVPTITHGICPSCVALFERDPRR